MPTTDSSTLPEAAVATAQTIIGPETIDLAEVTREIRFGWSSGEYDELRAGLATYLDWIGTYLESGDDLPSHVEGSGSIAVPIGETVHPDELFAALGEGVSFDCSEYDEYWVTVHYPNPEPVVTLIPKQLPGTPAKLDELCRRIGEQLGVPVGGVGGMFLAYLLPGFYWAMHTDHDNKDEQTLARIQVPLITNPEAVFVWGRIHPGRREEWLVEKHLQADSAHYVRVDVPHTVINRHASEPRLHMILDVHEEPAT